MSFTLAGFLVSAGVLSVLSVLFWYEKKNGVRFLAHERVRADYFVLKIEHTFHTFIHYVSRDFVKQSFHYLFHTLLRVVLSCITQAEKGIRNVMRVNKTLARYAERESTVRSKLEEIAIHKAEVALTEEEKKIHKERSLGGY